MYPERIAALFIALWVAFVVAYNVYMARKPIGLREEQTEGSFFVSVLSYVIVGIFCWGVCVTVFEWVLRSVFGWQRVYHSVWENAAKGAIFGLLISLFKSKQRIKKRDKSTSENGK